uniref:Uncharacterized protein n=1 Tax=Fusarium oxysporum (strain Fo5176) TaxID=660025 RepID=A0A0D2XXR8_FUSOF
MLFNMRSPWALLFPPLRALFLASTLEFPFVCLSILGKH